MNRKSFQSGGDDSKSKMRDTTRTNKKASTSEAQFSNNAANEWSIVRSLWDSKTPSQLVKMNTKYRWGNGIPLPPSNGSCEEARDAFGCKVKKNDGPSGFSNAKDFSHVHHENTQGGTNCAPKNEQILERRVFLPTPGSTSNNRLRLDVNQNVYSNEKESHNVSKTGKFQPKANVSTHSRGSSGRDERKGQPRAKVSTHSRDSSASGRKERKGHQRPNVSEWISIKVKEWEEGQTEQFSPEYRINGIPWRLQVRKVQDEPVEYEIPEERLELTLLCDKWKEAELWHCSVTVFISKDLKSYKHTFASWKTKFTLAIDDFEVYRGGGNIEMPPGLYTKYVAKRISVKITMNDDIGESWRLRPTWKPSEPLNGIIMIGDHIGILVRIESISSVSPFFAMLFNEVSQLEVKLEAGSSERRVMCKVAIGDVEFEEFYNLIKMIYGFPDASLTEENVHRVMELAIQFELKIVQDRVVSFLLSKASGFSLQSKLLFSDRYNIPIIKEILLVKPSKKTAKSLKNLSLRMKWQTEEWDKLEDLSLNTLRELFNTYCNLKSPTEQSAFSIAFSMVVENWKKGQVEQLSPIQPALGFHWSLRLFHGKKYNEKCLEIICDNPTMNEEWECTATVEWRGWEVKHSFTRSGSQKKLLCSKNAPLDWLRHRYTVGSNLRVKITIHGLMRYSPLPTASCVNPDGVLAFGEEKKKKKIAVNKQSLASLSPYFEALFYGNFMEKDMNEIPIGEVQYEDFSAMFKIICGSDGVSLNGENLCRIFELADRFQLQLDGGRLAVLILSNPSLSIHEKLLISDHYDLPLLMDHILSFKYNNNEVKKALAESPLWDELSKKTIRVIFEKLCI